MKTSSPRPSYIDGLIGKHATQPKRNNRKEEQEFQKYADSLKNVGWLSASVKNRVEEVTKINYVKSITAPNNESRRNNYYDWLPNDAKNMLRRLMVKVTKESNNLDEIIDIAKTTISLSILSNFQDEQKRQDEATEIADRLVWFDSSITPEFIDHLVPYRHG